MQNKSLSKNAILSSIRVFANIVFPLITYPYITRILSAEGIGKVDFSNSIISYFSLIGALGIGTFATRYGSKIKDDREKFNSFASQMFSLNYISCGIAFVLLMLFLTFPTKLIDYRGLIIIQSIVLVFAPMEMDWLYNVEEDFGYITIRSIAVQFISMIFLFLLVHSYKDLYIYVIIRTFSNSFANFFNLIYSRKYVKLSIAKKTGWASYYKSILVFFGNAITQTIYLNSDVTILGILTNDYYVGIYGVATKIYSIVKRVFNAAISVAIPRLSYYAAKDQEKFIKLLTRIIHFCEVLVTPAVIGLILFRKEIIMLISGTEFQEASTTLVIFALSLWCAILANILNNGVLVSQGKENKVLQATILSAFFNSSFNFVLIPLFKQNGAALTTLLAELIMVVYAALNIKDILKLLFSLKALFNTALGCIVMVGIYYLLDYLGLAKHNYFFILSIVICAFSYCGVMVMLKDAEFISFAKKIQHFLKQRRKGTQR